MSKIIEMFRKGLFYVRVLSGYELRHIRSQRFQLDQRIRIAQERKEAMKKVPEQVILSEVRQMVEEMQNLNKSFEKMETDISDYFKPIDMQVGAVMNMQMDKEKVKMEMMKRVLIERAEAHAASQANCGDKGDKAEMETITSMFKQALQEKTKAKAAALVSNSQKQAAE